MNRQVLTISTKIGLQFLKENEIIFCKAQGNYTVIHLTDGQKIMSSKKLKRIEEILNSESFFRIHHSHFINIDHLDNYKNGDTQSVIMSNGTELEVSKRKKSAFLAKFTHL